MSRKPKDELEDAPAGWHIFQEVSHVKIVPGLGVFTDPNPDLTPDAEGRIPIVTRASDSFEVTRFRATRARISQFVQENWKDLKDSGLSPETVDLVTTIAAGAFTEKSLREFMGDADEGDAWGGSSWESGKGWVTKKKPAYTTPSYRSWEDDWEGSGSYSGGYGSFYGGSSSYWSAKPKPYRTLSSQLTDITAAMKTEMNKGALRALENPADLTRVVLLKILGKIDVMNPKELDKWEIDDIVSSIAIDIRWDLGYSQAYDGLMSLVKHHLRDIVETIHPGVIQYLQNMETPERLMVDFGVLVDVNTQDSKQGLASLFGQIGAAQEAEAKADAQRLREEADAAINAEDIDFADEPGKIPHYDSEPGTWGRLRIIEHPLVPSNELRKRTVTYRPTDVGAHIGRLDRILTDKRIFREMRPTPTGSLLVDCSGSMGLRASDVHAVLKNVPGAVIGLYSGSGSSGVLHIVARAGKVAANLEAVINSAIRMGGNVVDGPSLDWLITMPKPRIWYSDGGVTGVSDGAHHGLRDLANGIMRKGGVGRIRNQKKVPAAFKHMRREKTVGRI